MARPGLLGGSPTGMPRGDRRRAFASAAPDEKDKKKKTPPLSVILRDAGELIAARNSERQLRVIDHDQDGSMELKKREGYF